MIETRRLKNGVIFFTNKFTFCALLVIISRKFILNFQEGKKTLYLTEYTFTS